MTCGAGISLAAPRRLAPTPRGPAMRRVVPAALVLLTLVPQACQRDEATAPQPFRPGAQVVNPATSKIAFWRWGEFHIYVMNGDGSGVTQLTTQESMSPSWSPDGRQLTFESFPSGIFVMNADGSGVTRLTRSPDLDGAPSWSPDGRQIAFDRRFRVGRRVRVL